MPSIHLHTNKMMNLPGSILRIFYRPIFSAIINKTLFREKYLRLQNRCFFMLREVPRSCYQDTSFISDTFPDLFSYKNIQFAAIRPSSLTLMLQCCLLLHLEHWVILHSFHWEEATDSPSEHIWAEIDWSQTCVSYLGNIPTQNLATSDWFYLKLVVYARI